MKKILISTGGTGGHTIPAEIISEHLKEKNEIFLTTDIRGYNYLSFENDRIKIINTPKLNVNLFLPLNILKLFYLIIKSYFYLKKNNISKVISTGGYMSLPVCIAAKFIGLKLYLIEPNSTLGRANKLFLNFSEKIICYSNNLKNFPKNFLDKVVVIKPLVFKNFYEIKKIDKIKKKKFCILIFGGSQGAQIFDKVISNVIVKLNYKHSVKVIQQTNEKNIKNLEDFYKSKNIENKIFSFEKKFIKLISESDLCISRAGSTSLAEISIMNKPFIAIPLPSAKDNHQMDNARFYEKKGCCWVINQNDLTEEMFTNLLIKIVQDDSEYNAKINNLKILNKNNSWNEINLMLNKIIDEN